MKIYKLPTNEWFIERIIFLIAGIFILSGLLLGYSVHYYFYGLVFLVGFMQVIFAITGYCPMAILLKNLKIKSKLE